MSQQKEKDFSELLRGAVNARLSVNRIFEILPFERIPGGDLSYTYKKKDDDNGKPTDRGAKSP